MKKQKEVIAVEEHEVVMPQSFPCSFKEFLRLVVGGSIPSAQKEADRTHLYRQFLHDTSRANDFLCCQFPTSRELSERRRQILNRLGIDETKPITDQDLALFPAWTDGQIADVVGLKKERGFTREQFEYAAQMFLIWKDGLRKKGISAARASAGRKGGKKTAAMKAKAIEKAVAARKLKKKKL